MICTREAYKNAVKMTCTKSVVLDDPPGLFNARFEGNTRRAIDVHAGDEIDEAVFKALLRVLPWR